VTQLPPKRNPLEFVLGLVVGLAIGLVVAVGVTMATAHGYHGRAGSGTAYCDRGATASGHGTRPGIVASNDFPLYTWVELVRPRRVLGRRYWQILDTGGPGFLVDFWSPSCSWATSVWGRRTVRLRAVPRHHLYRGLPEGGWSWSPR
jgi:hypothetical protein